MEKIPDEAYLATWHAVETGRAAKEGVPDLFREIASGLTFEEALRKLAPAVSRRELESIIQKIVADRLEFVVMKERAALGPLMGIVMTEVRGSVDGKLVSELLRMEIDTVLAGKKL
jgi:glutamyl-tRNA(Gln) amidotransferase subunit E